MLRATRPTDAVHGEETGHTGAVHGTETGHTGAVHAAESEHTAVPQIAAGGHAGSAGPRRVWLVDPLCGTLNYATGGMLVAVNVALQVGDDVTAAAVADPFSGEVFWVGADGGAYRWGGGRPSSGGRPDDEGAVVWRTGDGERLRPSATPPLVDVNLDPPLDDGKGCGSWATRSSGGCSGPACCPPRWLWPGWRRGVAPHT